MTVLRVLDQAAFLRYFLCLFSGHNMFIRVSSCSSQNKLWEAVSLASFAFTYVGWIFHYPLWKLNRFIFQFLPIQLTFIGNSVIIIIRCCCCCLVRTVMFKIVYRKHCKVEPGVLTLKIGCVQSRILIIAFSFFFILMNCQAVNVEMFQLILWHMTEAHLGKEVGRWGQVLILKSSLGRQRASTFKNIVWCI